MLKDLSSLKKVYQLTARCKIDNISDINDSMANPLGWEIESIEVSTPKIVAKPYLNIVNYLHRHNIVFKNQTAAAITALNTFLFGGYGSAKGISDKKAVEEIKQALDGVASNTLGKLLYFLTNNHLTIRDKKDIVYMVFQGEGAAEKAGSAAGSPNLAHGRLYGNPGSIKITERYINEYLADLKNESTETRKNAFDKLMKNLKDADVQVISLVIDTLENTSRSAKGEKTGPMTVVHFINGPLIVRRPYESYGLTLTIGDDIAKYFGTKLDLDTPPADIVAAIEQEYPNIKRKNIIIYSLGDKKDSKDRLKRLGDRWVDWDDLGVKRVVDGDKSGLFSDKFPPFIESGSYAPNYLVGHHIVNGEEYYFINDGYAAQAEAVQGLVASYANGKVGIMRNILPKFFLPFYVELEISKLDPEEENFERELMLIFNKYLKKYSQEKYQALEFPTLEKLNKKVSEKTDFASFVDYVKNELQKVEEAGYKRGQLIKPQDLLYYRSSDLDVVAVDAIIGDDPYSGITGIQKISNNRYTVNVRNSISGYGSFVSRFLVRPVDDNLEIPNRRSLPIIDSFVKGLRNFDTYEYQSYHAALIKYNLRDAYYEAISILHDETDNIEVWYLYKDKLIKMVGEERARNILKIIGFLKEKAGKALSWLEVRNEIK